ncbi:TonB-dependent receptor [Sphingobium sufflavum]|uniref:TonB-dependent receptor n=1 Tax=Sphingobium sufflavum TaxID=1129547 RepID=UPI001F36AA43|nr:TonB-dependent receptor [Sphingobium sufflavum]MCE7796535.1 TonB-dependent receptor [Sphingobium sufflavum]
MKTNHLIACSGLISLAWAYPAFAQSAQSEGASARVESEEIVVEARRKQESVQDVPTVVNVVTSDTLAKLNLRQFSDISTVVPGLSLGTSSTGIGGNASVRGVNFDVLASGNNGTVEFYFNDASIQAGALIQSVFDIGQIEVLRGPQGTLRGRASPSGSVTVTTHRPDLYDYGGYGNFTATDMGGYNANAAVNIPLIKGVAALRIAGLYDENRSTFVKPATPPGKPISKTEAYRISLRVEPTSSLQFDVMYQHLHLKARRWEQVESLSEVIPGAAASPLFISAKDRLGIADLPSTQNQTYDTVNWQARYAFAGQQLVYVGSYNRFQSNIFNTGTNNGDSANAFPGRDFGQLTVTDATDWTHELRLQNETRVFDMFDYVVGGFYRRSTPPSDITTDTFLTAFGNALPAATPNPAKTLVQRRGRAIEKSLFGNVTAHLGDSFEISGGVRYISFDETKRLTIPAFNAVLQDIHPSSNAWIYSASVKYQVTPDIMAYASTGSSWRPQIDVVGNSDLQRSALETSFLQVLPETSKSYEAGVKSSWFDRRLNVNVTGFHQTFKNYPYRAPGAGVYFINTSANTATTPPTLVQGVSAFNFVSAVPIEINGVEAEIQFRPSSRFNLGVNAAYSLGKIQNGLIPCNDLNSDGTPDGAGSAPSLTDLRAATGSNDISGCRVSTRSGFNSPFSANIQSEYNLPLDDRLDAYVRGLFTFTGASQGDPTNSYDNISSYGLLNLYTGVRAHDGSWEISAFVKNVANLEKVLTRSNGPTFTAYREVAQAPTGSRVFNSSYFAVSMTQPREFGLNLRVAFGSR